MKTNEEKSKLVSQLTKISGSSAVIGRQSVENVLNDFKQKASNSSEDKRLYQPLIDGYLGQVIDCFQFDPHLNKAVEVSAKSKLFHHIVQTDKIGTKIMKEVNNNKMLGDITFIAINRLNLKTVHYPPLGVSYCLSYLRLI